MQLAGEAVQKLIANETAKWDYQKKKIYEFIQALDDATTMMTAEKAGETWI